MRVLLHEVMILVAEPGGLSVLRCTLATDELEHPGSYELRLPPGSFRLIVRSPSGLPHRGETADLVIGALALDEPHG